MKNKREKIVVRTSIISIIANILLVIFKSTIGILSNSIAIISDAVNNLSDALSSIITIIGTKLAGKPADREHPYGHGRGEYIASLIVSAIVLYAGLTTIIESVKKLITPEEVEYNYLTIIILIGAILTKCVLGMYVKNKGREVNSTSLVASGTDAFNDAVLSTSVLISTIIYMIFNINLEAYVGIILSLFIVRTGIELIKESVDNMLGKRVESDLAKSIKKDIVKEDGVYGAFDLILNNYGPDKYIGSVHIEVEDTLTVKDIDRISRKISKNIYNKYGVTLHTIGVYSINTKDKKIIEIQKDIREIIFSHKDVLETHGFYLDKKEKTISFDIIIDFKTENAEELYKHIYDEIKDKYKDYKIIMNLDLDVSD